MRPRLRRIFRKWPYFLGLAVILLVYLAWPGRDSFTVSPETTYFTTPINAEGHVDYVQAVNEKLKEGITPENNANVLLWKVIGPHPAEANIPNEYFKWLGAPAPPEQGDYFQPWDKFADAETQKIAFDEDQAESNSITVRDEWKKHWEEAAEKPWTKKDYPEIARWLDLNEKPLNLFIEASKLKQFYHPVILAFNESSHPSLATAHLENIHSCRNIADALSRRALFRVANNQPDLAWADLLACLRLGRLISQGLMPLESMNGNAISQAAIKSGQIILSYKQLPSHQIMVWLHDLQLLPSGKPPEEAIDFGFRLTMLAFLQSLIASESRYQFLLGGGLKTLDNRQTIGSLFKPSVDWDPAFKTIHHWVDRRLAIARDKPYPEQYEEIVQFGNDVKGLTSRLVSANSITRFVKGKKSRGELYGEYVTMLLFPSVEKSLAVSARSQQSFANLQIALALAAYRSDHGRYPRELAALAPKYLPSLPVDRFSLRPLLYKPEAQSYLLYSVGTNLKDEQGQDKEGRQLGDDIAVRMPYVSPPPEHLPPPSPFEVPK